MFDIPEDDIKRYTDIRKSIEYLNIGNLQEALEIAKIFAKENHELLSAHILKSGIYEALNLPTLVLESCRKAIDLDNSRNDIIIRGIFACLQLNDEESAADFFFHHYTKDS